MTLLIGGDLAADSHMRNGRHENQEAPGQCDVAGDTGALLGDGLLGDLNQNFLTRLQQVADDGQIRSLRGAARWATTAIVLTLSARSTASTAAAASAITLRVGCASRLAIGSDRLFPFFLPFFLFFAVLIVEVELDAVIQMSFLQHFAQFAGANLVLKRLLLVFVQIVLVAFVVMMTGSLELLAFNHLFLDKTCTGGKCGGGSYGLGENGSYGRFRGLLVELFLLPAETEEAKAAGGKRIDVVRCSCVGLRGIRALFIRRLKSPIPVRPTREWLVRP